MEEGDTYVDIEAQLEEFASEFNANKDNFTDEKFNEAYEIIEIVDELVLSNSITDRASSSQYDENKAKLRAANYIETVLDLDEGLSDTTIAKVLAYAKKAKSVSSSKYPDDEGLQDAYRHFSWNHMMTDKLSKTKARTAGNNHEWGLVMLTPMTNYYDSMYDDYIDEGYSKSTAANKALASTIIYIPEFKSYMVAICEKSYKSFKSFFSDAYIMDFHNNCWGRAYADTYTYSYSKAFDKALKNEEIIKKAKSVQIVTIELFGQMIGIPIKSCIKDILSR